MGDIQVVFDWLDQSPQRPSRDAVARHSPATRNLWLLWQQLVLHNGVLYKTSCCHNNQRFLVARLSRAIWSLLSLSVELVIKPMMSLRSGSARCSSAISSTMW